MQKVKVVINQTVRRYNVSHKGIKFSSSTNVVGVGKSAYDIYKETTTDNPILNESDWIDSLYGQDGVTPTIGPNGNWFIGDTDTGTVASNGNVVPEKPYFNVPMKCPIPYVGLESEIEDGWSLCDGRNVVGYGLVPDMRGRFIVGADPRTASIPTNSDTNLKNYGTAGNTGGKDNVQLAITELPKHSFKTVIAGNNNEPPLRNNSDASIVDIRDDRSDGNNDYALDGKVGTPTLGKTNTVGDDQPHENRPPYYVVAFIIRTTYQNANGGKSAYDIAILNGFVGTEAEWLDSLNGKSAYQIALDYGFVGTIEEWILSIKGSKGDKGDKGDTGAKGDQGIKGVKGDTGEQGPQGTNGRGIVSRVLTSSIGLVDTYTTTYTDGATDTYTVTNGTPGTTLTADQLQIINTVPLVCSDEKTDLTASTDVPVIRFVFQTAQSFTKIVGELNTAAAGGTFAVVAKKNGVSFLSTPLTFDGGENTTRTASVPSVFTTPTVSFSVGDYVEIFITTIGAVTPGRGLKIYLM